MVSRLVLGGEMGRGAKKSGTAPAVRSKWRGVEEPLRCRGTRRL
ncbi:MAG: hypothetical protein AAFW70_05490 [Cyanobacteria bacterium J06635_10]